MDLVEKLDKEKNNKAALLPMTNDVPKKIEPKCERCGACCDTYSFWLTNRSFDNDPKEIKRLAAYHGLTLMKNKQGELGIKIPITCEHLETIDGKASCKIHDTRPVVCQEYFCEKAIKKAIEEQLSELRLQ